MQTVAKTFRSLGSISFGETDTEPIIGAKEKILLAAKEICLLEVCAQHL